MIGVVELAGTVLGLLQQGSGFYTSVRSSFRDYRENRETLLNTLHGTRRLTAELVALEKEIKGSPTALNCHDVLDEFTKHLKESHSAVEANLRYISIREKLRCRVRRLRKASETKREILEQQNSREAIEEKAEDLRKMLAVARLASHLVLERIESSWLEIRHPLGCRAPNTTTRPRQKLPPTPKWYEPDFHSLESNSNALAPAGKIRRAILKWTSDGLFASQHGPIIEITGQRYAGKSCAVRSLRKDYDLRNRYLNRDFAGGVCYVSSKTATTGRSVVRCILKFIEECGGFITSYPRSINEAVQLAISFFRGRDTAFIFDEEVSTDAFELRHRHILCHLSRCSPGSAVVFVKERRLLDIAEHIDISDKPLSLGARKVFLNAACRDKNDLRNPHYKRLLYQILLLCGGTKILLNSAGNCVRKMQEVFKIRLSDAMRDYLLRYQRVSSKINSHCHEQDRTTVTFHRMIAIVLEVIEASASVGDISEYGAVTYNLFSSLCCLEEDEWIAYEWWRRIWGFKTLEETKRTFLFWESFGRLGYDEERVVDGVVMEGFWTHKLMILFCVRLAEERSEKEHWLSAKKKHVPGDVVISAAPPSRDTICP